MPRADGESLCVPPFSGARQLAHQNAADLAQVGETVRLSGETLTSLRVRARAAVLAAACDYTATLRGEPVATGELQSKTSRRWYVTGHQPELFHPGVWIKNAAIGLLAKSDSRDGTPESAVTAVAVNLIVDNDLHTSASLHLPVGPAMSVSLSSFAYDAPSPVQPWEEQTVHEESRFWRFGEEVSQTLVDHWGFRPLIAEGWGEAVGHLAISPRLADCFAAMRHRHERRWGIENLELPMSRVCETAPFRQFAAHLMLHAAKFADVHNRALDSFRKTYRIRSHAHPVPPLESRGEWIESPFWIWQSGDHARQRLFVRVTETAIEFGNGDRVLGCSQHPSSRQSVGETARQLEGRIEGLIAGLERFSMAGWRLRTRALTTTLFARLCLADLFVHGIGGAKYDELTDDIARQFFNVSLPEYLTLTATHHLPLPVLDATPEIITRHQQRLRQLRYQGETFLSPQDEAELRRRKAELIASWQQDRAVRREADSVAESPLRLTSAARRQLHQELTAIQQQFQAITASRAAEIQQAKARDAQSVQANRILQNREYPWLLHPVNLFEKLIRQLR